MAVRLREPCPSWCSLNHSYQPMLMKLGTLARFCNTLVPVKAKPSGRLRRP
jgi:hypothetical protein